MITHEIDGLAPRYRLINEEIEHFTALQPPVHVIADVDDNLALTLGIFRVVEDLPVQAVKQVQAAMDIADGVKAAIFRRPGVSRALVYGGHLWQYDGSAAAVRQGAAKRVPKTA